MLGRLGLSGVDEIEYRFAEPRAFYLRVMPATACPPLKHTKLMDIASKGVRPDVLSQTRFAGNLDRNRFGVIALEPSGTSTTPRALTQLFMSGEIWGLSTHFFRTYEGHPAIAVTVLENVFRRVLSNYCDILSKGMGISPPYIVVLGAIGLQDAVVGFINSVYGPIHRDRHEIRLVLNNLGKEAQETVLREFIDAILDLSGATRA